MSFFASVLFSSTAAAASLDGLLARGELSLLETYPDGRLKQVTAIARLQAPLDTVWSVLTDYAAYESWMPQVRDSTLVSSDGQTAIVDWTVGVVGPDIQMRQSLVADRAAGTIIAKHVSGAMAGSSWAWKLTDEGERTLVERTVRLNVVDGNWLIKQVEDEHHTLDYGINSAAGVVELRGLSQRLER